MVDDEINDRRHDEKVLLIAAPSMQHIDTWERFRPGILLATLAGVATSLGALALPCLPASGPPQSAMAFSMSLAAGVMLSVSCELLWHHVGGDSSTALMLFIASSLLTFLLCKIDTMIGEGGCEHHVTGSIAETAPETTPPLSTESKVSSPDTKGRRSQEKSSRRLALLLFISLTAHNIPEGFAVAVSTASERWLGLQVCIAVALHNIPEGVTLAVATYGATKSRLKATLVPTLAGLTEPLGAISVLCFFGGRIQDEILDNVLASVAGVMCTIALAELMPEAAATGCWRSSVVGFAMGAATMWITHQVLSYGEKQRAYHHHSLPGAPSFAEVGL